MEILIIALGPGLRTASPILLAALGGIFTQRAGIFNIALEGYMLVGAFAAVVATSATGSGLIGVLAAVVVVTVMALLMGFVVIELAADVIVIGIAVNLLAAALTSFLLQSVTGGAAFLRVPVGLPDVELTAIAGVPLIGPLFASQGVLVLVSLVLIPLVGAVLAHTSLGLRMRAVGERPDAAISSGVDVRRVRYIAFALCGALCGLAGAQLSLGLLALFSFNMTAGRGIIAFAAVVFGAARARWVAIAALIFGFADAVANRMQTLGLPVQFVVMAPYILTIAVLLLAAVPWRRLARQRRRSSLGQPA
ncbi:MAG TPA: ABC transporter permease [Patescibacteria group bacterium]|nr:ABC transporter permease [Patescibacteria group bacterium]